VKEILVLANQHHFLGGREAPQLTILNFGQAEIKHVLAVYSAASQESGKRRRELIVDQEPHEARRTE
jgi:hypothetical protein